MAELPRPDYGEYFSRIRTLKKKDPFVGLMKDFYIPVEGSRGCFAHCDFCSMNAQWQGFRKLAANQVFERTVALLDTCGTFPSSFSITSATLGRKLLPNDA